MGDIFRRTWLAAACLLMAAGLAAVAVLPVVADRADRTDRVLLPAHGSPPTHVVGDVEAPVGVPSVQAEPPPLSSRVAPVQ